MYQFSKATKEDAKLRMSLIGPSGSGKTFTALAIATNLGDRVAVIDTEHGSAAKYADDFNFDVSTLEDFHPNHFIGALDAAAKAGYDCVVIDSLSHAWSGKGGALELVDKAQAKTRGNSFAAWKDVTPLQTAMVDAILHAPLHVIVTMRSKTEYVVDQNERGKSAPRKVGTAPIQRDGIEYEFDVVADLDQDNNFIVTKTRCAKLHGQVYNQAGANVAHILKSWLHGAPIELATAEEIAAANQIRGQAVSMGYLTDKNTVPNEVVPEVPRRVLVARQQKWSFYIDATEEELSRQSQPESQNAEPCETARNHAPSAPTGSTPDAPAANDAHLLTDAQHRAILAIAARVVGRPATADDFAQLTDKPLEELSKSEASALIDRLRYRLSENAQMQQPVNRAAEPRQPARRPRNVEHEAAYARTS